MITLSRFDLAILAVVAGAMLSSTVFVLVAALTVRSKSIWTAVDLDSTLAKSFVRGFREAIADWPTYFAPILWLSRGARRVWGWGSVVGLCRTKAGRWQLVYTLIIVGQSVTIFFYVLRR